MKVSQLCHKLTFLLALLISLPGEAETRFTVDQHHSRFRTIQSAVDAAPSNGGTIDIEPGIYREVVHIDKPHIHLHGRGNVPNAVVLIYANSALNTGNTRESATLFVTGDDFTMSEMTVQNDWSSQPSNPSSQAVALSLTGDKAYLQHVRILGAQDTLYAASKGCPQDTANAPCHASRQLFKDCYIEGHVDFIFGNAKSVFEHCEMHSIAHSAGGFITAQSKSSPSQDSGYVFDHCTLTADPQSGPVYLGRPWRPYSTVVYLNTTMSAAIDPAGWREWHPGSTASLQTATYLEYRSSGSGANAQHREPFSRQLTEEEAKPWRPETFLSGWDIHSLL